MAFGIARRDRVKGGVAAIAVTAALGWALIAGLGVRFAGGGEASLLTFEVTPDPPQPRKRERIVPDPRRDPRPEGEAAPPNLKSQRTEIVAPPVLTLPTPVIATDIAGPGADATQGAAILPGPGTGSGGEGDGTGSGRQGNGSGGGDGDETPPEWVRGRIRDSDYPRALEEAGIGGTVGVRYLVQVNGRATDCEVTRSSGSRGLDTITCRLIEERFRYRPSRDARGRPVVAALVEDHHWVVEDEGPAERR